jgi:phytoene dehydrogenase-like protein
MPEQTYDAVVVGSGPNGLAAAITLARAGRSVLVVEGDQTPGGGMRSAELTLPGFVHDVCSAIHPLGLASPFFRSLPLGELGLEWVQPAVPLAHPLEDGTAAVLERSTAATAENLGQDGNAYRKLMDPLVAAWEKIIADILGPLPLPPRHPLALSFFGLHAIRSARALAEARFSGPRARALFAGMAAHAILPLEQPVSASFGLVLGMLGHAVGWPMARGGSQRIAQALVDYLHSLGGELHTGWQVDSLDVLPPCRAVLLDVTPRQLLGLAGKALHPAYASQLARYRYGPGVFKVDFALSEPIPWKAAACTRTATVHLGGTLPEIAAGERRVWQGQLPERPYVILTQQSPFDPTRAPQGRHTAWAYCHVPAGSNFDMTERIEAQVERFAPGFRDCIMVRHAYSPAQLQAYNPNYVGGDINGGVQDLGQLFTRPAVRWNPYRVPTAHHGFARRLYLCSSSTPPGGGVHGMCGYHAACTALRDGM